MIVTVAGLPRLFFVYQVNRKNPQKSSLHFMECKLQKNNPPVFLPGSYFAAPGHPKTGGAPKRPNGPRLFNIAQTFAFVKALRQK